MTQFHDLPLTDIRPEGRDGVCLSFRIPDTSREAFCFTPGQYVTLRADVDGEDLRRPYSICSVPASGILQVGVKRVEDGRMSNFLNDLTSGGSVQVMPPDGRFLASAGEAVDYLLIAAGSGVTPMLSIAEAALAGHPDASVTLVYGNRETGTIMFLDRLSDLKDQFLGRLKTVHILSREMQDSDLFNGRIDRAKLEQLTVAGLITPEGADGVYLCGPEGMINAAETYFIESGLDADRIHAERFLPADGQTPRAPSRAVQQAVAEGVEVETVLDGLRRSFRLTNPDHAVLAAAQSEGIDLPFSCANGMCCTCRCRIAEGSAEMAVNYSLEQWEIDAGFTLACQARPTSEKLVLDFDAV